MYCPSLGQLVVLKQSNSRRLRLFSRSAPIASPSICSTSPFRRCQCGSHRRSPAKQRLQGHLRSHADSPPGRRRPQNLRPPAAEKRLGAGRCCRRSSHLISNCEERFGRRSMRLTWSCPLSFPYERSAANECAAHKLNGCVNYPWDDISPGARAKAHTVSLRSCEKKTWSFHFTYLQNR
jgi:hypothetical protein